MGTDDAAESAYLDAMFDQLDAVHGSRTGTSATSWECMPDDRRLRSHLLE